MSNTLKISRSLTAALITVCLLLTCMPFGRVVRADAGETYYLYAKFAKEESGTSTVTDADFSATYKGEQYEDYEFLGALYSDYQSFTVPNDYKFCLNGTKASFNGKYGTSKDFLLLDSTLRFTDITVSSKEGTGLFGYKDREVEWVNDMLDHLEDEYIYLVDDQQSFTLNTPSNGDGAIFETDNLTVEGTFSIANNTKDSTKPNMLRIVKESDSKDGSLIAGSGSIVGSGNARLEIGEKVLVKGGLKLFKADGTALYDFDNLETGFYYHTSGTKSFTYDATLGGWKLDEGGNDPVEPPVYEDPVGGDGVYFIFIDNDKLGELQQHEGDENYNPNFKESDFKIVANTFAPQDGYSWYAMFLNGVTGYDITTKNTPLKDGNVKILANNSTVVAGDCYGADFELYGSNSTISFTGTNVTTDNNVVYNGGFTAAMDIVTFVMSNDLAGSYLFTFTANRTIESDAYMGQVLINSGVKLTIGNNSTTPNAESAVVWVDRVTVNGTLEIVHRDPGENVWPNELHIVPDGSLTVGNNGSLIGGSNSILALERGVKISGIDVYSDDGSTVIGSSTQDMEQAEAFVYSNGKWVRTDFGGPNNDFEGVQVRFDDHYVAKVEYSTDGQNYSDLPEGNVISKDDIPNVVYFKVTPKQGEENKEFEMGYIDGPDFEIDERNWQWTTEDAHIIQGNILFAVEKSKIKQEQFVVDIHTKGGGFDENYEGIEVRYDGGRLSNVQYSVDNGEFQDLPNDHIITKDAVGNCTSIRFKAIPKTGEENRNYVLDYVDGPDYSVSDETWVRTRVEHDDGENYIFTINKTVITKSQFVVDIFADEGGNPPQPQNGIQVNYDNHDITISGYYFDNDSSVQKALNNFFIPKEELAGHSSVTFLYTLNGIKAVNESRMLHDNSSNDFTISDIGKTSLKVTKTGDNWPDYFELNFATDDNVYYVTVKNAPEQPNYGTFSSNDAVTQNQENGDCDFSFNLDNVGTDTFTITPKEGYVIWKLEIQGEREGNVKFDELVKLERVGTTNTYKIVYVDENNKMTIGDRFTIRVDYRFNDASIVNDIINNRGGYAYYTEKESFDEIAADLKNCLTTEIYCYYRFEYSEDYPTVESVASALNVVSTAVETDGNDPLGLPFVRFTLSLNGAVSDPFRVYILDGANKYIIKLCVDDKNTEDTSDDTYQYLVVDATAQYSIESGRDMVLRLNYVGVPIIFGNGAASVGVMMSDSSDIFSCHVTQDASNIDLHYPKTPDESETFPANSVGSISSRLVIMKASEGASAIIVKGERDCLGWDFQKIDTFSANENPSKATEANIYIGSSYVWIKSVNFDNTTDFDKVTGVYVDTSCGVQEGAVVATYVSEGTYKLTFNTAYDYIRLRITVDDGSGTEATRYINLHRVAFQINDMIDTNFRDSSVQGGQPNHDLPEGDMDKRIFGTYSYKEGTSLEKLKLAVTITYDDGTTEFKIIKGTEFLDYGVAQDQRENFDRGYADFVLWKGSESDYKHIKRVEVIVSEDDADTFGGVVVGSGRGVVWNQEGA